MNKHDWVKLNIVNGELLESVGSTLGELQKCNRCNGMRWQNGTMIWIGREVAAQQIDVECDLLLVTGILLE